jgi:broad specificity phosphatase PhoE
VDVARRRATVLNEIEPTLPAGNVLLVSYKATVRIMLCSLLGLDVGRYRDRISMSVFAVNIVEMTAQGPLPKVLGNRTHLREGLRLRPGA